MFHRPRKFFQGPAQSIHVYRLMREGSKLHDKASFVAEIKPCRHFTWMFLLQQEAESELLG